MTTVDLFAGPGGWDVAAADLWVDTVGLDTSVDACDTATAAGHKRELVDVTAMDPHYFGPLWGLIGSPPCQGFSIAGKGMGRVDAALLLAVVQNVTTGADVDEAIARLHAQMTDARSVLTLEPLRWALHTMPEWVALEQVPGVLPIWQAMAVALQRAGYVVSTGYLHAEAYGVPQTRKRAVLMARRSGLVHLPTPTHSRYHSRRPDTLDPDVLPWVSMAQALGWSPEDLVGFARLHDRGDMVVMDGVAYRGRDLRVAGLPSAVVTEKARSWSRFRDQSGTPFDPLWPAKRPATAVAGRGLVQNPGETSNRFNASTKSRNDGVRVTVAEAAALQTFPDGYPWAGSQSSRYQQVGDAVPPTLARAILEVVMP